MISSSIVSHRPDVWNRAQAVIAIAQNREWKIVTRLRAILLWPLIPREARKLNRYSSPERGLLALLYFSLPDVYATGSCAPEQKSLAFSTATMPPGANGYSASLVFPREELEGVE